MTLELQDADVMLLLCCLAYTRQTAQ